jgi:hypothetical protein
MCDYTYANAQNGRTKLASAPHPHGVEEARVKSRLTRLTDSDCKLVQRINLTPKLQPAKLDENRSQKKEKRNSKRKGQTTGTRQSGHIEFWSTIA